MQESINNKSMLRVGTMLRGIYRIESYLSSGGFGNTYVATNVEFDERVAIKEFFMKGVSQRDENQTTVSVSNHDNAQQFEEQREKFKKEARRLRKLRNDHLVSVHDLFEENGTAYYVMDYVDGENLGSVLKRKAQPLSEAEVWDILPQVLDALKTVHQQGIWHLDLKPANIMQDKDGVVKLIDFGASKQLNAKGGATTSTAVSYTNGFAPREQMEQNLEKFGPWTDLYALGATLYNLLSGKRPPLPTDIDDDTSANKHLALPLPAGVSDKMRNLVLWLMSTNRMQRPQSVEEIQAKLIEKEPDCAIDEETIYAGSKPKPQDKKPQTAAKPRPQPQPQAGNTVESKAGIQTPKPNPFPKKKGIIIGVVSVLACVFIVWFITMGFPGKEIQLEDSADTLSAGASSYETDMVAMTPFGECTYTGEVDADGRPHGVGEAKFSDGSYYKGPFVHGDISGEDAYYRSEDGDTFEGEFRDNNYYEGKYTIASDGSYFVGTYKDDEPVKGKWYDKNGKIIGEI
ncbi:MAG: protein kinase [Bacteroidaceae bacterium]|nr:protein kinase [Bacteroidaceae bacterium]